MAERLVCSTCRQRLLAEAFTRKANAISRGGSDYICRECKRARNALEAITHRLPAAVRRRGIRSRARSAGGRFKIGAGLGAWALLKDVVEMAKATG